ncbi:MAG: hypothetical protein PHZ26_04155 [Candidatus Gracilibacteria bacterium]|nr:hypothetical protein [Candidatus Gracilibacteria bacterium]MDD2908921.1 hypothetical protein [Candidatus Gracilibacteria bacterium]
MKTKIITTLTIAGITTIGFLSTTYADSSVNCKSVNKEVIKTILDKKEAGTILTTSEQTTLENMKSCFNKDGGKEKFGTGEMNSDSGKQIPPKGEFGSGMTDEQKAKMDEIKTILEKKKTGVTLTSDEQSTLDQFEANKPQMGSGEINKERKELNGTGSLNNITNKKTKDDFKRINGTGSLNNITNKKTKDDFKRIKGTSYTNIETKLKNMNESKLQILSGKVDALITKMENSTNSRKDIYIETYEELKIMINELLNSDTTDENINIDSLLQ